MRHVMAKLLIFSILFANLTWAADMGKVGGATEPGKLLLAGDQTDEYGSGQDIKPDLQKVAACDQYCHWSGHYTWLLSGSLPLLPKADCADQPPWLTALQTFDQDPPLHPPKI